VCKPVRKIIFVLSLLLTLVLGVSCRAGDPAAPAALPETSQPTATEAPAAARVNGKIIPLSDYEAEVNRYRAAVEELGNEYDDETAKNEALQALIDQLLLVQAAEERGYIQDAGEVDTKISELAQDIGGQEQLAAWMGENFFTEESFRQYMEREIAAIWMRNQLLSEVPVSIEQVHARQILVQTENQATAVQMRLQAGATFEELAFEFDPLTGGDLGWFPRGYLLQPAVEEAAFNLQPGQVSSTISTDYGYHIVKVIERGEHPLSPSALMFMQEQALLDWLENRRTASQIEILVP